MPLTTEHKTEFLSAFADAFLAWQYVENTLFMIFNELVRHERPEIVSAIFYVPHSLPTRLRMIDEVFKLVVLDAALKKKWGTLLDRVGKRSRLRNKFAHLTVTNVIAGDGTSTLKLAPTVFKISSRPTVEHDTKEIKRFGHLFRELADDLYEFHKEIGIHLGKAKSPPKLFP